jgi:hypothetical protein
LIVGSLPGLVADLLSMATGAAMLVQRSSTIRLAVTGAVQRTTLPKGAYRSSQRPSDNSQRQSI